MAGSNGSRPDRSRSRFFCNGARRLSLACFVVAFAALVIGAPADLEREDAPDASTDELILRCVPDQGFPVITNVDFGHAARNIQLPLGCRVEFDLSGGRQVLRYLEDLVAV